MFHCLIIKDLCRSDSDQLVYFITELFVCQELFLIYFLKFFSNFFAVLSISNSFILSNLFAFVKNFFNLFWISFFKPITNSASLSGAKQFVKNFFHKKYHFVLAFKRRRRDLNPRAGYPTYTLSRGASSATWVLLQMPKYKMICLVTHSWRMIYYTKTHSSCQPVFSIFLFFLTIIKNIRNYSEPHFDSTYAASRCWMFEKDCS